MKVTEATHLTVYVMPCCAYMYYSVGTRRPNFCPECGTHVLEKIRLLEAASTNGLPNPGLVLIDSDAMLSYTGEVPAKRQPKG